MVERKRERNSNLEVERGLSESEEEQDELQFSFMFVVINFIELEIQIIPVRDLSKKLTFSIYLFSPSSTIPQSYSLVLPTIRSRMRKGIGFESMHLKNHKRVIEFLSPSLFSPKKCNNFQNKNKQLIALLLLSSL